MKYIILRIFLFLLLLTPQVKAHAFTTTDVVKNDSVSYYIEASNSLNNQKKYNEALAYAQKAKRYAIRNSLRPQIAESYFAVGSILLNQNEYKEAERNLRRSISISKKFNKKIEALAYYKLAVLYAELNDFEKAEENFSISSNIYKQLDPEHRIKNISSILIDRAYLFEKLGKIDNAKAVYKKIIDLKRIDKNTIIAYVNLSNLVSADSIYWSIQNLENIEKQYETIDYKIKSAVYLSLANLYLRQKNSDKSTAYLKKYIEVENQNQIADLNAFTILNNTNLSSISKKPITKNGGQSVQFIKLMSIMSIALISVLSLLSLSLYRNNKERMRINLLLQNKNTELEIAKNNAEKATKARSEFLSTVSHELRTPLNAINGITHILLEENPKETQLHYLKSLEFSGDYLLRFINDILEINRVESGNVQIEEITYNIRELLENIIESFSEISRINDVSCKLEIDANIPPLLIGDPTKISQIFMNLIGNAMKFAKNGSVLVTIKQIEQAENSIKLLMQVKDTGIGISPEKQQTIFENFTQGSVEINRKYGGTGLGLAIVKSLIELLGGNISLESEMGVGSTFSVTLEQQISDKAEIVPVKIDYDEAVLHNKHVLIVEDNKINQMITEKMLSKKEMTYETVENGNDAITVAQKNTFDLILMDIHLPGINGTIAAEEIRKFNTTVPIIALTAISLNENREALLAFGMDEVITKPFQSEKFYQTISQVLTLKSMA
ncbi:response regulator [Flavobacterium agricola]|uniref:histidine kinase n=1 Tax=Flavobacterium agricola TaxID=2870839 RepID=A0ABY6M049_9FLAO|nr:ATP-binding protein [Flavobacterium agricola]UYW01652.1 response regulator [Flavobacterium agricola]